MKTPIPTTAKIKWAENAPLVKKILVELIQEHEKQLGLTQLTMASALIEEAHTQISNLLLEEQEKVAEWFDEGAPRGFSVKEWLTIYRTDFDESGKPITKAHSNRGDTGVGTFRKSTQKKGGQK